MIRRSLLFCAISATIGLSAVGALTTAQADDTIGGEIPHKRSRSMGIRGKSAAGMG